MTFLDAATGIPEIISCRELSAEPLREVFSDQPDMMKRFEKNAAHVRAYRIEYRSQMHMVVGFVVEPLEGEGSLPCIIECRGGCGEFGKWKSAHVFGTLAEAAQWGYILITTQYSGNDGGEGQDEIGGGDLQDVRTLYDILNGYERADINRIGMSGGSRGGMMTYMMLTRVPWIKAAVVRAGTADLLRNGEDRPKMKETFAQFFDATEEALRERSALCWPEKFPKNVPVLIMHGTGDWRVSPLDSYDLARHLYMQKVPHRLVIYEGADHGLRELWHRAQFQKRQWLDRFVKNLEPLPDLEPHGD